MKRNQSKSLMIAAAVAGSMFAGAAASDAAVLYDNTGSPRFFAPSDAPDKPLYFKVAPTNILWDDVDLNTTGQGIAPNANVTRVTFNVLQLPGDVGGTVNAFWTALVPDVARNGGAGDLTDDDPGVAHSIGGATVIPANISANVVRTNITFGDGVNTLFNTGILNQTYQANLGIFLLGLQFSNATNNQGWTVATHPDNLDVLWDDNQPITQNFSEFTYSTDSAAQPIIGTNMVKVEGSVVPEPTTLGVLGAASVGLLMRRRSRKSA